MNHVVNENKNSKYFKSYKSLLINQIKINEKVVIVGAIISFGIKRFKKGKYFQLIISDNTGTLDCIWFHGVSWILEKF